MDSQTQCILCGTIVADLEPEDVVTIQYGDICIGCLNEGYFKRCSICNKYEFEDQVIYSDQNNTYTCKSCFKKQSDGECP